MGRLDRKTKGAFPMGRNYNPDDFIMQYPGVYHPAAQEAMAKYLAMIDAINTTEVTGQDIVNGTIPEVKLGATLPLSGDFIRPTRPRN